MKQYIGDISERAVGSTVELAGWVHVRRNMGKLVFVDLRDSTGIMQIVCVPQELDEASRTAAEELRPEYVVHISGSVQKRSAKQVNVAMSTGTIEVLAKTIQIVSKAKTPPFEIENEDRQANEELRLQYRYLDLRHERLSKTMRMRHRVMQFVRNYLSEKGFVEIQTPILSKSTPEGARDYLVPSRLHKGKFFALPQSPQQYKQLLMVAGFERYFQIAPCFRDEDARADRSPGEFYQIDMEMSFVTQDDILALTEKIFIDLAHELFPEKTITKEPFPRLNYADVMKQYGTDKPDLRNDTTNPNELAFAWIVNFPLFVKQTNEDHFHGAGKTWAPSHHMFTAPRPEDVALLDSNPGQVRGLQHDLVLNGFEIGGGSVRIHDPAVQQKVFDLIGFTEQQKKQFQHMLTAFEYGVPPHGGIAPGLDRLIMILAGEKNLREVTAFPLTNDGRDPMMDSPSEVEKGQLEELGIALKKK
ncbi:MAG: aspartate--tRNA ligase [Candidatus Komeilibacteria bacterium]|nr:aspartate--tRNA ligase [Candidatus Komeilibacteria bacterium]